MSINANCQRCRQPLIASSLPSFPAPSPPSHPHQQHRRLAQPAAGGQHVQDSVAALSPSTYDFLSASDRFTAPAASSSTTTAAAAAAPPRPAAGRMPYPQMYNLVRHRTPTVAANPVDRIVVPPPPQRRTLGPQDSYIVLTDSVISPNSNAAPAMTASTANSTSGAGASAQPSQGGSSARRQQATPDGLSTAQDGDDAAANSSSNSNNSLQAHLAQLSNLYALLSLPPSSASSATSTSAGGGTGLSHPLCTECTELLFELMTRELDALKKERDRLLGFEKDVHKRRDEVLKQLKVANPAAAGGKGPGELELKEALEKDIAKVRAGIQFPSLSLHAPHPTRLQRD